ncbi:MAG: hypothetical protein ACK4KW_02995 [Gemmobacter sp.]
MTALRLSLIAALMLAAGCETRQGFDAPSEVLAKGFRLGHVAVVADQAVMAPISRSATAEEWQQALDAAVRERFGRLEGDAFYHLGVFVDGYAIAPPGIPLVASPKSVLIISVSLFEDQEGGKRLHEKPQQLTVFESLSGDTVIGSGLTRSKEEQMRNLAFNAALAIEDWLNQNPQLIDPTATAPAPAEDE